MTTLRLTHGPLLLLLYQAAPLAVQQDSLGRYRISVGFAAGQWENEEFSCDGQLLSSAAVRHRSAGVQVDAWPDERMRVTAFAGSTGQSLGPTFSADSLYGLSYIEPFAGIFGGAQLAYEGQRIGIGVGVTHLPNPEWGTAVAPYLRIGDIDRLHFRMEGLTPNPVLPSISWARIGMGFNNGHLRRAGGFVGVGLGPFDYSTKAVLAGDIRVPLARRVAGQLHGLVGPGEKAAQWSLGAGLRFDFGPKTTAHGMPEVTLPLLRNK